jgi:hypothetical protein
LIACPHTQAIATQQHMTIATETTLAIIAVVSTAFPEDVSVSVTVTDAGLTEVLRLEDDTPTTIAILDNIVDIALELVDDEESAETTRVFIEDTDVDAILFTEKSIDNLLEPS